MMVSLFRRLSAVGFVMCVATMAGLAQQAGKVQVLRIGTSGTLFQDTENGDKSASETLRSFVKGETGYDNEVLPQQGWDELAAKLTDGKIDVGVFSGHEFAWAQEQYPKLQPLVIAVNKYRKRWAYVMVRQDDSAKGFADLKGQAFALPHVGQTHLPLFIDKLCRDQKATSQTFFGRITTPENLEDALDDVVDGAVKAAVVDFVGLENYQRRKPGRAKQLRELLHSPPVPPPVVAYAKGALDEGTLKRFHDGLIQARQKEKGQKLLTFFKLTAFEDVPANFNQVLEESRKNFPPANSAKK